ncbi:DUF6415 family natural product biosynthesis protein [Streptomyces sp. NPDC046900]|uniref:DUF6415 family natural product biosynthesis protein n=1 Tax=Streptomyces sp. NPDC046900 TaxID=3155473 RepID=UPI0033F592BF
MTTASSGLAVPHATAMPSGPGKPGPLEVVDADTIRETYEAALGAPATVPKEERALLGELLHGHVRLLFTEVAAYAPRMQGEQQRTAVHVMTRTRHLWRPASASRPWTSGTWPRSAGPSLLSTSTPAP